jgi:membrane fusion protein (multidrug efflux system)
MTDIAWRGRPRVRGFLVIAAIALAGGGLVAWSLLDRTESTDDAQIDGHIVPVASRIGGTVLIVRVHDNQHVNAGDVLVELDPRDYELALARVEAELADARAAAQAAGAAVQVVSETSSGDLHEARATVRQAEAEVAAAEAALKAAGARRAAAQAGLTVAETSARKASADLARLAPLAEKEEISRAQYDAAVATADTARASVASARAGVVEAENEIAKAESEVARARGALSGAEAAARAASSAPSRLAGTKAEASAAAARVQRAEVAVAQAKMNLEYTRIKATRAGLVSRRSVEVGQTVQSGQPLLALVPLDDVWVTANFKETQLQDIRPGQPVEIDVDAYDQPFEGVVHSIAAATGARFSLLPPENASGNFVKVVQRVPVKIVLEPGPGRGAVLRPGMSVHVAVQID